MAHTLDGQGDRQAATAAYEQSVALFREEGDQWALTHPLCDLAWHIWDEGRLDEAFALIREYLAVFRRLRSLAGVPMALDYLISMAIALGEFEVAAQAAHEKHQIEVSRGLPIDRAYGLSSIASVDLAQGNLAQARTQLNEALLLAGDSPNHGFVAHLLYSLGLVALYDDHLDEAAQRLRESRQMGEGSENHLVEPQALFRLGEVATRRGDYASGLALMQESLTRLQHRQPLIPAQLEGLAHVCLQTNRPEQGVKLLGAADHLRRVMGSPILPVDQPRVGHTVGSLRTSLGADAFAAAWTAGEALSAAQAVALALELSASGEE